MWKIKCYTDSQGRNEVQKTYDHGSDQLRASFESALEYLTVQPRQGWMRPRAAKLTKVKKFRDFYEIRFKANKVQQRPIGYFGPGADNFTILMWAIEKGNALQPSGWHSISMRHMEEIQKGLANAKDLQLDCEQAAPTSQEGVPTRICPREH